MWQMTHSISALQHAVNHFVVVDVVVVLVVVAAEVVAASQCKT